MKISIITVVWNNEETIGDAIESVIGQDYDNFEYIIVDGGSTDSTLEIIDSYSKDIDFIVSEKDDGLYHAMNKGIDISTGDVIGILNSDDIYSNESVITDVCNAFLSNPHSDIFFGSTLMVDPHDINVNIREYNCSNFKPWMMRFGFAPPHPSSFIKKNAYINYGVYKQNFKNAADFEIFLRLLYVNKLNYIHSDKVFVKMRIGGTSTSGFKANLISSKEILEALLINNIYSNIIFVYLRFLLKIFQFKFFATFKKKHETPS